MRRVGVFGGTFDPVHLGHLGAAAQAQATFHFDELLFVPAGDPPHKQGEPLTPFAHRFAMLTLATRPFERYLVSDIERQRPGPTYTVDTLRLLRGDRGAGRLRFLMGSDSFVQVTSWHRWDELLDLADIVVLHRVTSWGEELVARAPAAWRPYLEWVVPGALVAEPEVDRPHIFLLDHAPFPVSATDLRRRLRDGEPASHLLPPEVYRYIVKYHLYEHSGDSPDGR
jgi:nicotinate-nucleotide adenylyltransferase